MIYAGRLPRALCAVGIVLALFGDSVAFAESKGQEWMIANIRKTLRTASPDADTPQFERVLDAMRTVPRDQFVSPEYRQYSYEPVSIPIGYEQTISDAYVVALMSAVANVRPGAVVLDVGTGSGYQAAVLARLGAKVTSIEIVPQLADGARQRLAAMGYTGVEVRTGDGYAGAIDKGPFDAIVVAAGSDRIPRPLLDQVKVGGVIVMPIGTTWANELLLVVHKEADGSVRQCSLGWTMFVPLTGQGRRADRQSGLRDRNIKPCYRRDVVSPVFLSKPLVPAVPLRGNR